MISLASVILITLHITLKEVMDKAGMWEGHPQTITLYLVG